MSLLSLATPIALSLPPGLGETIVFAIVAPLSIIAAIWMVLSNNAVYSALLLVINLFCLAVMYVLLNAQFLAAVQIVVYAGAIMVLFLFVVMLLGVSRDEVLRETIRGQRVAAIGLGVLLVALLGVSVGFGVLHLHAVGLVAANAPGNTQALGALLFTHYLFAFELTGLLLVVAAIGALVLARHRP